MTFFVHERGSRWSHTILPMTFESLSSQKNQFACCVKLMSNLLQTFDGILMVCRLSNRSGHGS
jgi:hypothetical protein